ncbi:patatin-like phospholipase family protein [Roseateles sp. BYS180W]|uniref:Patatin-like phospholipase family protein n=1 Tax=Roseateles rivi TaxID=3299028 RepID=A0ABW7FW85_9BURK
MTRRRDVLLSAGALWSAAAARAETPATASLPLAGSQAGQRSQRWALVLGGGTARGFAHIGVLKALHQYGLTPDLVVGCSAGALVGALYASGQSPAQLEELALRVRDSEIADVVAGHKRGLLAGDALQAFVNRVVRQQPIEKFRIPFAAVATNISLGEQAVFTKGNAGLAVRASSSIPGIFIPVRIQEHEFVDGGIVSPLPVRVARDLGAQRVVAVSLNSGPMPSEPQGMFELMMQSFDIMANSLTRMELRDADVAVRPNVAHISTTDFNARNQLIVLGEQAARHAIGRIRTALLQAERVR